jgi:hypothetical protein
MSGDGNLLLLHMIPVLRRREVALILSRLLQPKSCIAQGSRNYSLLGRGSRFPDRVDHSYVSRHSSGFMKLCVNNHKFTPDTFSSLWSQKYEIRQVFLSPTVHVCEASVLTSSTALYRLSDHSFLCLSICHHQQVMYHVTICCLLAPSSSSYLTPLFWAPSVNLSFRFYRCRLLDSHIFPFLFYSW